MIRHKLRSHRRPLPPVVLGVGLLLIMRATAAATFDKLEVTQHESQYQISGEVYLNATPQQVYSLLTDCRRLPEINPNVRVSEVRKVINIHNQLVYTETQVCVLIFCRTIKQIQLFTELDPSDIVAVTVPGTGNVKQGMSSWRLQADGGGTRLSWSSSYEPDFWVPTFIGVRAIETRLRSQALESVQTIERLAQEQAAAIPNARMSI